MEKYYQQVSSNFDLDSDKKNDVAYQGYEGVDELKEEMDKIKIMCIATMIMEMTRMLPNDKKLVMESFCDKLMLNRY